MIRPTLVVTLLLGALLMTGCKEEVPPNAPTPPQPPVTTPEADADATAEVTTQEAMRVPVTGDDVLRETGEAVDTAAAYADQNKDKFIAASQEKLESLKARWSSWKADADVKADEAKAKLNEQYAEASEKLRELKSSSGEAWGQMKDGFVEAYQELEAATKEAAQEFGEEPAPTTPEPTP